ncbi:MAG: RecX family transcriptional regulator [Clostridia bacterium]|nr:RecX family transcriptional regulator [Clostridia bacterium]
MRVILVKKEKAHLTRVAFAGGTELLLDREVCAEKGLCEGTVISEAEVEEIKGYSDYVRAKNRALWYLDRSDYTEKALYTKLLRAGFDKRACAAVLARLVELGVVDDVRFAERYAERCVESNISEREALSKMLSKGVPYDIAKSALADLAPDEAAQIAALIKKKYAYKLTCERGTEKVFAALVRRGFSYGAVREAMKKYNDELEFGEEY